MPIYFNLHENDYQLVAGVTGLEPATSCVKGRRSNQTELHPQASLVQSWCNLARTLSPLYIPAYGTYSNYKHLYKIVKESFAPLNKSKSTYFLCNTFRLFRELLTFSFVSSFCFCRSSIFRW